MTRREPRELLLTYGQVLVACVTLASFVLRSAPFILDDAFITFRYAAHLAEHGSLAFNLGHTPVEGFSSPLWMLLLAGAVKLFGHDAAVPCAWLLGFVGGCGALGLLSVLASGPARQATPQRVAVGIGLVWLAVMPPLVRYSVTGLEHAWFLACVLAVAGAAAERVDLRAGVVCAALAPWLRPEGCWIVVAVWAQRALACRAQPRALLRDDRAWALSAAAVGGQATLSCLRWLTFHDVVPNTYWAKPPASGAGVAHLLDLASTPWGASLVCGAAIATVLGGSQARSYALAAGAWFAATALEGGDWMPDGRLALPAIALCIAAVASGQFVRRPALALCLVVALVGAGCAAWRSVETTRLDDANYRSLGHEAEVLGRWLAAAAPRSVALVDIGALGFHSDLEIVDLAGLTDREIARSAGRHLHKTFDLSYVFDVRAPDVIVLRLHEQPSAAMLDGSVGWTGAVMGGIEERVAEDPRLRERYRLLFAQLPERRINPYYGRLVFARAQFVPATEVPDRAVYVSELPAE